MSFIKLKRWHRITLAGLAVAILYGVHFLDCSQSILIQFPFLFQQSDMYANLLWARLIQDQGWLNPHPYHPYELWMQSIGTEQEWVKWWGGTAIFQQSPLYAYFLSGMFWLSDNIIYVNLVQSLMAVGLCILTGLVTYRMTGESRAGWLAFWIAVFYSPYYAYSWTLVRDLLAWTIAAAILLLLLEASLAAENKTKRGCLLGATGFLLGVGYLARESFLVVIPLVVLALFIQAIRQRIFSPVVLLIFGLLVALTPLIIRNKMAGAPLLSSSNRFAEGFIMGNASGARPNEAFIPPEMKLILEKTGGRPGQVVLESLKSHPSVGSFLQLEFLKAISLFDPYEAPDNMSIYFMENFSPPIKWGLRHWMIIVPGVAGLILSLCLRDKRHFWLWLMLVPLLAGVLVGTPISRYRQSLMILWMPWAAYFLCTLWRLFHQNRRLAWTFTIALLLGWTGCLTVFARVPKAQYERPGEYFIAISAYENSGQVDKAEAMKQLFREKFPGQESMLHQ